LTWADLDNTNTVLVRYLLGDGTDQILTRTLGTGASTTVVAELTDRLGSVRDLEQFSNQAVVDHLDYDGFGNPTESSAGTAGRYQYTGREYDTNTGLQYNRARYYDPTKGSWLSEDSLSFTAEDANLYRYVRNNPTNMIDASGKRQAPAPTYLKATTLNGFSMNEVYGPFVQEERGAVKWEVKWEVPPRATGWIVQRVDWRGFVWDTKSGKNIWDFHQKVTDFFEAWQVVNGVVYAGFQTSGKIHVADTFDNKVPFSKDTYSSSDDTRNPPPQGSIVEEGVVQFVPTKLDLPVFPKSNPGWFSQGQGGHYEGAGSLPTFPAVPGVVPPGWKDMTGGTKFGFEMKGSSTLYHALIWCWDGPGKQDTKMTWIPKFTQKK
jgi:RHS repeat-associated protein